MTEAYAIKDLETNKYLTQYETFDNLDKATLFEDYARAKYEIEVHSHFGCEPVKVEVREVGKKKRVETMVELFAHLITRNDDRPFNYVWDMYFADKDLGHKNIEEVEQWLNEEVDDDGQI